MAATIGGALVLFVTVRRQWHAEIDSRQQQITEQYSKAVEHLASDQAPARIVALHMLERIGQDNLEYRQRVADALCGYLRMPYYPPVTQCIPGHNDGPDQKCAACDSLREEQVRRTVEQILNTHVSPGNGSKGKAPASTYWGPLHLNLSGAVFYDFAFVGTQIASLNLANARAINRLHIEHTHIAGNADFTGAKFDAGAILFDVTFHRDLRMRDVDDSEVFLVRCTIGDFCELRTPGKTGGPYVQDCLIRIDASDFAVRHRKLPRGYTIKEVESPEGLTTPGQKGKWGLLDKADSKEKASPKTSS
ncbi:hypothetical protein AB0I53_14170 [Saccharopolyspora sp. NPDC050389]|uniref:hypothetical protein n=1 Tax=Saccharopolyspora sp. NPDC050389 TaxID=3155516 RepID=UPI0033E03748